MKCSVGSCQAQATVEVEFHDDDRWDPFCRFHAYAPSGRLRWDGVVRYGGGEAEVGTPRVRAA